MKEIKLKSQDWYNSDSYPEYGFYIVEEDVAKDATVSIEPWIVLFVPTVVYGLGAATPELKEIVEKISPSLNAADKKELTKVNKAFKEVTKDNSELTVLMEKLKVINENLRLTINEWKKKYNSLREKSLDKKESVSLSEDFVLKAISLASGNDKFKDL